MSFNAVVYCSSGKQDEFPNGQLPAITTNGIFQTCKVWVDKIVASRRPNVPEDQGGETLVTHLLMGNSPDDAGMDGRFDDAQSATRWAELIRSVQYAYERGVYLRPYVGYRDARKIGHPLVPNPYLRNILTSCIVDRMSAVFNPLRDYEYRHIFAGEGRTHESEWQGGVCVMSDTAFNDYKAGKIWRCMPKNAHAPWIILGRGERRSIEIDGKLVEGPEWEICERLFGDRAQVCIFLKQALLRRGYPA